MPENPGQVGVPGYLSQVGVPGYLSQVGVSGYQQGSHRSAKGQEKKIL